MAADINRSMNKVKILTLLSASMMYSVILGLNTMKAKNVCLRFGLPLLYVWLHLSCFIYFFCLFVLDVMVQWVDRNVTNVTMCVLQFIEAYPD